jgi:hypothetical protein
MEANIAGIDPLFHAHYRFRRRDFDGCIEACNALLAANPYDQVRQWLRAYLNYLCQLARNGACSRNVL